MNAPAIYHEPATDLARPGTIFKRFETDEEYRKRINARYWMSAEDKRRQGANLDVFGDWYDMPRRIVEDTAK